MEERFNRSSKQLTTITNTTSGMNLQGSGRNVTTFCSSRNKLPSEGRGSETPRPRAPRLASVMMNTGTAAYLGTIRPGYAGLGEHHVITLGADVPKTIRLENFD